MAELPTLLPEKHPIEAHNVPTKLIEVTEGPDSVTIVQTSVLPKIKPEESIVPEISALPTGAFDYCSSIRL